jgi:uncharacterized membrane protein
MFWMYVVVSVSTIILYFFKSPLRCFFAVILEVPAVVITLVLIRKLAYNDANLDIILPGVSFFILLALIIYFRPAKMAEIQPELVEGKLKSSYQITRIVYILQVIGFIFPLMGFIFPLRHLPLLGLFSPIFLVVAVLLNYAIRTDVCNTWLESRFRWQIQTFRFYFLPTFILFAGGYLVSKNVAIAHLLHSLRVLLYLYLYLYLWIINRTMKGWTKLFEGKSV